MTQKTKLNLMMEANHKTVSEIIDEVLIENNSHWLTREQAIHSISEGHLNISTKDVMDIVSRLPIHIHAGVENIHVEIINGVITIKPYNRVEDTIENWQVTGLLDGHHPASRSTIE
jgi:hypothetical protein